MIRAAALSVVLVGLPAGQAQAQQVEVIDPVAELKVMCQNNDAGACSRLGNRLLEGDGIARDDACALGEAESCFTLGRAYQTGNGRDLHDVRGIALLEHALALDPLTSSAGPARKALAISKAALDDISVPPANNDQPAGHEQNKG
ncbi:sel1 repeat family protein [Novosphingobium resinovorum]|nr:MULTISPECIES: sel1 repeat family protein [Novosphingobium]EZP69857.1 TPR repeat-containing protein precursor [Novosphingobium resinovorum]MBF7014832.1 sel1 repeat family protein [Novosphingobium sp. HR1a]WJM24684.1 sel1 repeat family protein [Novosphingobium resinovorum]